MAGDWIKLEINTFDKPEVMAITVAIGLDDPDYTVGKLAKMWRWFDQHTTDGNAVGVTSALLDRYVGVTGFCSAMQSVGWLVINNDGITLPHFDFHNGKTAKQRAQGAKRAANHRVRDESNADSVTSALPREEKRREDKEKELTDVSSKKQRVSRLPVVSFSVECPVWIPADRWAAFVQMRKQIKKPLSQDAAELALSTLARLKAEGHDPVECLNNSILNSWAGIFAPNRGITAKPSTSLMEHNRAASAEAKRRLFGDMQEGVVYDAQ